MWKGLSASQTTWDYTGGVSHVQELPQCLIFAFGCTAVAELCFLPRHHCPHREKYMYCQNCGSFVGENVRFCHSCGKSQVSVPLPVVPTPNVAQVPRQTALPKKQSKVFWLIMGGILLAIIAGIISKSPSGSSTSTSTTQQSSAPNPSAAEHRHSVDSSTQIPNLQIQAR